MVLTKNIYFYTTILWNFVVLLFVVDYTGDAPTCLNSKHERKVIPRTEK